MIIICRPVSPTNHEFFDGKHSPEFSTTSNKQLTLKFLISQSNECLLLGQILFKVLCRINSFNLMQPHKVGIIIKPILKMKKHAQKSEYLSFLKYYTMRIKHVYTLSASNLDQETL